MNEDIIKFKNTFDENIIDNDFNYIFKNLNNYTEEDLKNFIKIIFINLNKEEEIKCLICLELIDKLILLKYPKFIKLIVSSSIWGYWNKLLINTQNEKIKNTINLIMINWNEVLGNDKLGKETVFRKNYMSLVKSNVNLIDENNLKNYIQKIIFILLTKNINKNPIKNKDKLNYLLFYLEENYPNMIEIDFIKKLNNFETTKLLLDDNKFLNYLKNYDENIFNLINKTKLKLNNKNDNKNENINKFKNEINEIKNQINILDLKFNNLFKKNNYLLDKNYRNSRNNLLNPFYNNLHNLKNKSIDIIIDETLKSQLFIKKILIFSNKFFKIGFEIENNLNSVDFNFYKPKISLKIIIKSINKYDISNIEIKLLNIKKELLNSINIVKEKENIILYYDITKKYFGSNFLIIKLKDTKNNVNLSIPLLINIFKFISITKINNLNKDNLILLKYSKFNIDNLFLKSFSNLALLFKNQDNNEFIENKIIIFNSNNSVFEIIIKIKKLFENNIEILFYINKEDLLKNKKEIVKILNDLLYIITI